MKFGQFAKSILGLDYGILAGMISKWPLEECAVTEKKYKEQAQRYKKTLLSRFPAAGRKAGARKHVAFLMFCTGTPKEVRLMICIGDIMRSLGIEVSWIVCEGAPQCCQQTGYRREKASCAACRRIMHQVLEIFEQPIQKLQNHDKSIEVPHGISELLAFHYKGRFAGDAARYSSYKLLGGDRIDDDPSLLRGGVVSYVNAYEAVKKTLQDNAHIDFIFTMGGQYAEYRGAIDAAADLGRSHITYENYGNRKLIFAKDKICFTLPVEQVPLQAGFTTERGRQIVDEIKSGKFYGIRYNSDSGNNNIDLDNYILIAPNIVWDSATFYFESPFYKSQLEWIVDTAHFCAQNNLNLVVRFHPADVLRQTDMKNTLYYRVSEQVGNLPNVRLISHESKISTYDLLDRCLKGVVFVSSLGLEMPNYDIPTIVVGEAHYKYKGFTYDPKTRDEYYQLLLAPLAYQPGHKERLYDYVARIDNFMMYVNYGDFYKHTGADEWSTYGIDPSDSRFPFDDMELDKFISFVDRNILS